MSRILVFSDIHANLVALEAVLEAAGEVTEVWNLGDVVGYGPRPRECVERVIGLDGVAEALEELAARRSHGKILVDPSR